MNQGRSQATPPEREHKVDRMTKFRVYFSDGHSIVIAARNPEEAKSAGTFLYPEFKVMKVKRVGENV